MTQKVLFRQVVFLDYEIERAWPADLLIRGDRIHRIEAPDSIAPDDAQIFDGGGAVALLPGFVNGHSHLSMTLLRGLGENLPLDRWLQ